MRDGASSERALRPVLTVALITAVLAEVMRVSFPLLYDMASDIGFMTAAWLVPVVFAAPMVFAPLGRWLGAGALLVVGGAGLAVARVILQLQDRPTVGVALTGTLLGIVALAFAVRAACSSGRGAPPVRGFYLGLTIDAAVRLALTTWDAAWQSTPFAWVVGVVLPVSLVASVIATATGSDGRPDMLASVRRWGSGTIVVAALLGPVFALQTLFLASPGFVASSGGIDLPLAGAIVLAGLAIAAAMPAVSGPVLWAARVVVVAAAAALTGPTGMTGIAACIGVVAGQGAVAVLMTTAFARHPVAGRDEGTVRTWAGAGVASLLLVGVLLPYQISYELPLGLPQFVFPVLGAVLVVVLTSRIAMPATLPDAEPDDAREREQATAPDRLIRRAAVLAPVLALGVPLWSALTWPEPHPTGAPASASANQVRVATYNIHSAVSWHGELDPESIARVLEDGGAEVTMLQEVSRGWPLAGGLDTAAWLSRRLGADVVYGEAADHQFGNAVLSAYPIVDHWSGVMDRGAGTMQRGYVGATVSLGRESGLDVWSTHLQHQDHTTATRRAQAQDVLDAWQGAGRDVPAVIGGDFNSRPGSADIEPWFDATGLVSAQDVAGDPGMNTSPAFEPDHRIDWILGSRDVSFSAVDIPSTLASDHLPVFATVEIPGE